MHKLLAATAIASLLLVAHDAIARDEKLSFRRNGYGVAAVVSGLTEFCNQQPIYSANTIERSGNVINVNSILFSEVAGCPVGTPSNLPYEVVASLGDLAPGSYTVTWTTSASETGPRSVFLSASLTVPDDGAARVPALSAASLVALLVMLLVTGIRRVRTAR